MNVFLMTMIYSSFHRQEMKAEEALLGHTYFVMRIGNTNASSNRLS